MSDKMSIAQALRRIKKLKGQIAEHTTRATQSVSYEQGKLPPFRFKEEMLAKTAAQKEMIDLQSRVAVANAKATVSDAGETITHAEAIRRLQEFKGEIAFLKGLYLRNEVVKSREADWDENKNQSITRVVETTFVSDLSEKERDQQVRELQNRFEVLNNAVEDRNHKVGV